MQHIAVTAELRPTRLTKGARKSVRKNGGVLASVFGKGLVPQSVILTSSALSRVLNAETGANTLVDLKIGATGTRQLARVVAIEMNPITNRFNHVGLQVIAAGEARKATVNVTLVGIPEIVKNNTAIIEVGTTTVEIMALPEDSVGHLDIDISGMGLDDTLKASDLPLPARVLLLSDPTQFIVSVRLARNTIAAAEADKAATEAKAATAATAA